MVVHREVPRTAAFAWSPGPAKPLLATGTKAGAVDADFSSDTQLELWDLGLDGASSQQELQPAAQISTDSRFHDLAWVQPKSGHSRGVIAGGLENGSLDLWDASKLLAKSDGALMSRTTKHTGAIKAVQFNAFRSELLASAGAKGELYISDLNNIGNPFRLGTNAGQSNDFECLDWNKQVPHIMVTGSSGGFVNVWDVKAKKESLSLNNNGRKAVSAVAWDPEKSTRVITAVPLDADPLILVWDLRNANAPEKILRGHEGGVLSLSWCRSDPDLLLSCGKDNRTICWNPQTGQPYGDFPIVTNWTFQTKWNPHNPNLLATASFDGKIAIRSIQNTKSEATAPPTNQGLEGADFFDKAASEPQTSSFSLPKAPKWLQRPCSASFGFGGKIVSVTQASAEGKPTRKSTIRISNFTVDSNISTVTEAFAKSMAEGDLKSICQAHIDDAKLDSEKNDWRVIETLLEPSPRKALVRHLGVEEESADTETSAAADESISAWDAPDDDADFFEQSNDTDSLLPKLALSSDVKTNSPFKIHSTGESAADQQITRALMRGNFMKAMETCLKEDRLSDALMIATCGGDTAMEKVKQAYFKKRSSGPNYIRLLASLMGKNLWDLVHNADLSNWKEIMASLCTYASPTEFSELSEALGDRLEQQSQDGADGEELRQSAAFCYIAGANLEKVIGLWIADLQKSEENTLKTAKSGSSFSIHAAALQSFIEKVSVFRKAANHDSQTAGAEEDAKLAPLYQRYIEYADIVSAHGQLKVAESYLALLPKSYQTAQGARDRVQQAAKPKVPQNSISTQPQRNMPGMPPMPYQPNMPTQSPANQYGPGPGQFGQGGAPQPGPYGRPSHYGPPTGYQPTPSMYAPQQAPQQPYPPGPSGRAAIPPPPTMAQQGPPRAMNASPSIAPPSQDRSMGNWNDLPDDFAKAPTPRRGTPSQAGRSGTPSQQYAPQQSMMGDSYGGPGFGGQPPPKAAPAPPPKGAAPPPPKSFAGPPPPMQNMPERPPSTSQFQPSQPPSISQAAAPPPRGPSPYNPPPQNASSGGGGSRYALAPGAAPPQPGPPNNVRSPPPNQYAAPPSASQPPMGGPPPPRQGPPQGGPPPSGPPRGGPPPQGGPPQQGGPPPQQGGPPPQSGPSPQQQQQQQQQGGPPQGGGHPPRTDSASSGAPSAGAAAPPPANNAGSRHPSGDRTHIPDSAKPAYDLLLADMQRVKSKAPASFKAHVVDTEKRLNILFDHLNNESLLSAATIAELVSVAEALAAKEYDRAMQLYLEIVKSRNDECTNWGTGVKRLISMSRATP